MTIGQKRSMGTRRMSNGALVVARFILSFIVFLILFLMPCSGLYAEEWDKGGNLHNASVNRWLKAAEANRLATSADWFLAMTKKSNPDLQKEMKAMDKSDYEAAFKYYANRLERCVEEKVEKKTVRAEDPVSDYAEKCYKILHARE
jgi:hypothetical protein